MIDKENKLDDHLELNKARLPPGLKQSAEEIADQLDLALLIAQTVFKKDATPELAIQVYDRLIARQANHQN